MAVLPVKADILSYPLPMRLPLSNEVHMENKKYHYTAEELSKRRSMLFISEVTHIVPNHNFTRFSIQIFPKTSGRNKRRTPQICLKAQQRYVIGTYTTHEHSLK